MIWGDIGHLVFIAVVTFPLACIIPAIWLYRGIRADEKSRAADRSAEFQMRLHHREVSP